MNNGSYCRPLWILPMGQEHVAAMVSFMYFVIMSKKSKLLTLDTILDKQALLVSSTRLEF